MNEPFCSGYFVPECFNMIDVISKVTSNWYNQKTTFIVKISIRLDIIDTEAMFPIFDFSVTLALNTEYYRGQIIL